MLDFPICNCGESKSKPSDSWATVCIARLILTSTVIPGRSCTDIGSDFPGRKLNITDYYRVLGEGRSGTDIGSDFPWRS